LKPEAYPDRQEANDDRDACEIDAEADLHRVQDSKRDDQVMHQPQQRVLKPDFDMEFRKHALLQEPASVAREQRRYEDYEDEQQEAENRNAKLFLVDEGIIQVLEDSLDQSIPD
jgi:hypothetical protein